MKNHRIKIIMHTFMKRSKIFFILFFLLILISCQKKEIIERDELFSFIENISESNIYKYELITLDEVMELNLKPSLEIRTGDVICKPFYPIDKEKKGVELFELCFDFQKKKLYLNELMNLTNTNIK